MFRVRSAILKEHSLVLDGTVLEDRRRSFLTHDVGESGALENGHACMVIL
jgi:hypothetical protein